MINNIKNQKSKIKNSLVKISGITLFWIIVSALLLVVTRFGLLGILPPGGANSFWFRLPTACASVLSIIFATLIIYKLSANKKLVLFSGLFLAISPWHIEQSRIYSPAMLGLTVSLGGVFAATLTRKSFVRLLILVITGVMFYLVYPSVWIFNGIHFSLTINEFLQNLFKLISVDFLFYHNDSFWAGGFRTQGVLLVSYLPLLLPGLWYLLTNFKVSHIRLLLPFLIFWILAASNPLFPDQREFFLVIPYLAVATAYGAVVFFQEFESGKFIVKTMLIMFAVFFVYEQILFFHWYTVHYHNRIKNERIYELEKF